MGARKPPRRAEHGQCRRVLQHGQDSGKDNHRAHEDQSPKRRDHVQKPGRRENGQVQHSNAPALHQQGIDGITVSQPPAQGQQDNAQHSGPGHAQLHRQQAVIGSVFEQEGNTEEKHNQADLDHRVPAGDPGQGL